MSESREYALISKRSKQILGQEVLPTTAETSGCTGQSTKENQDKDKRRNQVLQAQRTHRQRTQMYIKMLEREVLRLRESEREAQERAKLLQQQLNQVHNLTRRETSSPAYWQDRQYGHVHSNIEGDRGVYVHVEFPESSDIVSPATTYETTAGTQVSSDSDLHSSSVLQTYQSIPEPLPSPDNSDTPLADPKIGIKFVLGLETDCMDHLRGKHLDHVHSTIIDANEDFSGHISTACLSLWQQHTSNLSEPSMFDISSSELDRLLSSSLNLGLTPPEITPVQIWNRIRWLRFSGGQQALDSMTKDLREHVVCLGFGAVLDESSAEDVLKRYFSQLPPNLLRR